MGGPATWRGGGMLLGPSDPPLGGGGLQGGVVGGDVRGKLVTKPMSNVAALHLEPNEIRYQINAVPTPTVAWTRQGYRGGTELTKKMING